MLRAICHTDDGWSELADLDRISDLLETGTLVWAEVDVASLGPGEMNTIQQELGLHPLAVEDAVNLRQRPKLEAYGNHLFAVMHQLDEVEGQLEAKQLASFAGKHFVLTIHEQAARTIEETSARLRREPKPRERGPSYVMHTLLDAIVDDYEAKASKLEEEVEALEETLLAEPRTSAEKQLYSIKQRLARLRRYAVPGERILSAMVAQTQAGVADETSAYFRDIEDHLLRIIDQLRNVQDLVDALIELRRIEQSMALNEATKRLSGWAAIVAVPTFIASVYGMNFELIPNEQELFGFLFAVVLMLASGLFLFAFFKRRGWI